MRTGVAGSSYTVQAIGRAVNLLRHFTPLAPERTLTDLSRESGLPKSTTHRLLQSLAEGGLIESSGNGTYRLGHEVLRLGNVIQRQMWPEDAVFRTMRDLSVRLDETVGLATLVNDQVLILEQVEGSGPFRRAYSVGARVPAHITASGLVLLSALSPGELAHFIARQRAAGSLDVSEEAALAREVEAVRGAGHALDKGKHIPGLTCIAVPVRTPAGSFTLALAISGPAERMSPLLDRKTIGLLHEVARGLGQAPAHTRLLCHAPHEDGTRVHAAEPPL